MNSHIDAGLRSGISKVNITLDLFQGQSVFKDAEINLLIGRQVQYELIKED